MNAAVIINSDNINIFICDGVYYDRVFKKQQHGITMMSKDSINMFKKHYSYISFLVSTVFEQESHSIKHSKLKLFLLAFMDLQGTQ